MAEDRDPSDRPRSDSIRQAPEDRSNTMARRRRNSSSISIKTAATAQAATMTTGTATTEDTIRVTADNTMTEATAEEDLRVKTTSGTTTNRGQTVLLEEEDDQCPEGEVDQ